ncbi:MAG: hypothetical protein NTW25_01410, partial [Candidatus Kapabacteria bacterium]|nr:hypothetical protein [Candidatus Kapabacteria bacterium]
NLATSTKSYKLKNESDKDYKYFVRFLELGSVTELANELKGKTSERNLYYISERNNWVERKNKIQTKVSVSSLDKNIDKLAKIQELEIDNTIDSLYLVEFTMNKVISKLQNKLELLLENEEENIDKITKLTKDINLIVSQYRKNSNNLKEKLVDLGIKNKPKEEEKVPTFNLDKQMSELNIALKDFKKTTADLLNTNTDLPFTEEEYAEIATMFDNDPEYEKFVKTLNHCKN